MNKKEITNAYKNTTFTAGVFQVTNTVNNKIFIEGSVNLDKIWNRHRTELNFGGHRNTELQKDWKTYGEDKFQFEILDIIVQKEGETIDVAKAVKTLEQMYLDELQPFGDKGYNVKKRF